MSRESKRTVRARRSRARTVRLERGYNGKLYYMATGRGHHHQSGGATPGQTRTLAAEPLKNMLYSNVGAGSLLDPALPLN